MTATIVLLSHPLVLGISTSQRNNQNRVFIYVAENVTAMWAMQVALVAVCLLAPSGAYFFESGYTHHYTYWAENSLFDQHNVSMILKVRYSVVLVNVTGSDVTVLFFLLLPFPLVLLSLSLSM